MEAKDMQSSAAMDKKKSTMGGILAINKLKYVLPSKLGVVERRQNKTSFADSTEYKSTGGSELAIRLTATTDYVYGKNCYLAFDVKSTGNGGNMGFSHADATSLFSRVLFEDRSGAELERNDKVNSYCAQVLPWKYGPQYSETVRAMGGQFDAMRMRHNAGVPDANPSYVYNGQVADYDLLTGNISVCIPLRHLLGVFDRETLIPPTLLSGSRITLSLESATTALHSLITSQTDQLNISYTITNPRIVLDSMSLAGAAQKNLLEQTQKGGGLDFVYETVYYQGANPGTSQNYNLQINKAVSRAQKLYWSSRAQVTTSSTAKFNLGTCRNDVKSLDYRIGDLYMPQRVITCSGTTVKTGAELYQNSLQSVKKMKCYEYQPSISKHIYLSSGVALNPTAATNDNDGYATHVQSFEMSSSTEYSGVAVNNSRTLEARINFGAEAATARVIDSWLQFVKIAKCNLLRSILKE